MDWSGYTQGMFTKLTVVKTASLPSPLVKYDIDTLAEDELLADEQDEEECITESDIIVTGMDFCAFSWGDVVRDFP
jgi:hypothetical protein